MLFLFVLFVLTKEWPMKKIPSLFKREYGSKARLIYDEIVPGTEWAHAGEGVTTRKIDGTSCLIRDGKLYKRYDAKAGRTPPDGFEPAQPASAQIHASPKSCHYLPLMFLCSTVSSTNECS
jgi:hypothetical protein